MKKTITLALLAFTTAALIFSSGCRRDEGETNTLKIGATAVPHAILLELIRDDLLERGIELEIVVFTEFDTVNPALADGNLDANFFQHVLFLENWVRNSGRQIVSAGGIHIEPMGVYSNRHASLNDLPQGATVGIPADAMNAGRALALMEELGLITLREGLAPRVTVLDIVDNPLNLVIREVASNLLPAALPDLDLALINTNWALQAGLSPTNDTVAREGIYPYFVNVVAVRAGDETNENIQILMELLQSDKIREYILERWGGDVVPAF
ncbi:MAG: MetQ/NlpA family ABC transporter substrate-binding protein [Defluviitaleaceae bacterium]|nr:MetQ/NlpA family ABC transporter substrate-binding protein [Defluviitaleaceae bacterium]